MSREQFIEAERRVRRYLCLILFLTACAAIGLGFALPAWAEAREWLRAQRGEGAVRLLVGLLVEVAVLGPRCKSQCNLRHNPFARFRIEPNTTW